MPRSQTALSQFQEGDESKLDPARAAAQMSSLASQVASLEEAVSAPGDAAAGQQRGC